MWLIGRKFKEMEGDSELMGSIVSSTLLFAAKKVTLHFFEFALWQDLSPTSFYKMQMFALQILLHKSSESLFSHL